MDIKKLIREIKQEFSCPIINVSDEIKQYINKFDTAHDLLKSGGIPIEMLDNLAFGFNTSNYFIIDPKILKIKWKDDIENVYHEVKLSKLTPKQWSEKINLSEPIDVSYSNGKFYVEDGHHRYYAALTIGKQLNMNLTIKDNPITKIAPSLDYDKFHICIFNQYKL